MVKTAAYAKSLDSEERLPLETYLEIVEMKKVVEKSNNWHLFKAVFNIPEPGEKGFSKNLKWMERINELRRIPGHPAKERKYKVEDFQYIDFVYDELIKRIKEAQANPVLEDYRVNRTSVLAADTLRRRQTTELLITSYDLRHGGWPASNGCLRSSGRHQPGARTHRALCDDGDSSRLVPPSVLR